MLVCVDKSVKILNTLELIVLNDGPIIGKSDAILGPNFGLIVEVGEQELQFLLQ